MAGLAILKKRLRSVELAGQIASAMKSAASAKYAKVNRRYVALRDYMTELDKLLAVCGGAIEPPRAEAAERRNCYLLLGHNRGFCGGYNTQLHHFADKILENDPDALLLVVGKSAIAYTKKRTVRAEFVLPDVPELEDCRPLLDEVLSIYRAGLADRICVIRQKYVNTLVQEPEVVDLIGARQERETHSEILQIPDGVTVGAGLWERALEAQLFWRVLESAIGAQAATLTAMRTASDNAAAAAEKLENEINKKRQSAVTAGELETASGAMLDEEETYGKR